MSWRRVRPRQKILLPGGESLVRAPVWHPCRDGWSDLIAEGAKRARGFQIEDFRFQRGKEMGPPQPRQGAGAGCPDGRPEARATGGEDDDENEDEDAPTRGHGV
jgi:hypothetical protein